MTFEGVKDDEFHILHYFIRNLNGVGPLITDPPPISLSPRKPLGACQQTFRSSESLEQNCYSFIVLKIIPTKMVFESIK